MYDLGLTRAKLT